MRWPLGPRFHVPRLPAYSACMALLLAACTGPPTLAASTPNAACAQPDDLTRVQGDGLCLVIRTFAPANPVASVPALFIVLHGDTPEGGPSTYAYTEAQHLQDAAPPGSVTVAMIRPGYFDDQGNTSEGSNSDRRDSYTPANIAAIAGAILTLKSRYHPRRVVLVGHSGGAAIAGVILGKYPHLADAAVLVSCPCDIVQWRATRGGRPWTQSESPSAYVDRIPTDAQLVAITGSLDTNTPPFLGRRHASDAAARGVAEKFVLLPGADHNTAFQSPLVIQAAEQLANGRS